MRRALADPELFTVLFRRHVGDVHRFVARRTRDSAVADDITAATFEKCWSALPRFRPERASLRPWLFRIAANELASHYRSERRRSGREQLVAAREAASGERPDPIDDELLEALGRLSERHQVVLSLRFLTDLSTEETAAAMGVSRRHCAVIQHRALAALRTEMGGTADG